MTLEDEVKLWEFEGAQLLSELKNNNLRKKLLKHKYQRRVTQQINNTCPLANSFDPYEFVSDAEPAQIKTNTSLHRSTTPSPKSPQTQLDHTNIEYDDLTQVTREMISDDSINNQTALPEISVCESASLNKSTSRIYYRGDFLPSSLTQDSRSAFKKSLSNFSVRKSNTPSFVSAVKRKLSLDSCSNLATKSVNRLKDSLMVKNNSEKNHMEVSLSSHNSKLKKSRRSTLSISITMASNSPTPTKNQYKKDYSHYVLLSSPYQKRLSPTTVQRILASSDSNYDGSPERDNDWSNKDEVTLTNNISLDEIVHEKTAENDVLANLLPSMDQNVDKEATENAVSSESQLKLAENAEKELPSDEYSTQSHPDSDSESFQTDVSQISIV